MKLNSIKLKNFRQFKNVMIDFSMDENKPFTIIKGQNTFGKTTLIKAFLWCLYRKNTFKNKDLLNLDVSRIMQPNSDSKYVEVEIVLDHGQYTYCIKTKEEYYCRPDGKVVSKSGKPVTTILKIDESFESTPVPSIKVEEVINEILRPELTDYFFFDGESNTIEKVGTKKNLKDAVSDIMGIKRMETLKELFNPQRKDSVVSALTSKLVHVDDTLAAQIQSQIDDCNNDLENYRNEIKELEKEIENLSIQKENKETLLDDNKDVIEDQTKKKSYINKLNNCKIQKNNEFNTIVRQLNDHNMFLNVLFSINYLKHNIKDKVKNTSFNDKNSLSHISEEVVDQLIKRGRCLCGAIIENENDAYKHLIDAKNTMEPRNFGKYLANFISVEDIDLVDSNNHFEKISTHAQGLVDLIIDIDETKDLLKKVRERLEGRPDVGEIQKEIGEINYQIGVKKGTINTNANVLIPKFEKRLETLQKELEKNSVNSDVNDLTNVCINYARNIYNAATNTIDKKLVQIREDLTNEVNNVFSAMYHGNRKVVIDDEFNAKTEVYGNKNIDTSTGAETVKNYAFVAGLIKLVKNKINNDDLLDPNDESEVYPLVVDAPFSSTDEVHIANICNELPKYCNQLIFAVMEKDFKHAESTIENLIGKKYVIVQHSETDVDVILED